jgi:hypothetical protein
VGEFVLERAFDFPVQVVARKSGNFFSVQGDPVHVARAVSEVFDPVAVWP